MLPYVVCTLRAVMENPVRVWRNNGRQGRLAHDEGTLMMTCAMRDGYT